MSNAALRLPWRRHERGSVAIEMPSHTPEGIKLEHQVLFPGARAGGTPPFHLIGDQLDSRIRPPTVKDSEIAAPCQVSLMARGLA